MAMDNRSIKNTYTGGRKRALPGDLKKRPTAAVAKDGGQTMRSRMKANGDPRLPKFTREEREAPVKSRP